MRCILYGHREQEVIGTGDKAGRRAIICAECFKILREDVQNDDRSREMRRGYRDFETA